MGSGKVCCLRNVDFLLKNVDFLLKMLILQRARFYQTRSSLCCPG